MALDSSKIYGKHVLQVSRVKFSMCRGCSRWSSGSSRCSECGMFRWRENGLVGIGIGTGMEGIGTEIGIEVEVGFEQWIESREDGRSRKEDKNKNRMKGHNYGHGFDTSFSL